HRHDAGGGFRGPATAVTSADRHPDHALGYRDDGARRDGADRGAHVLVRGDDLAAGTGGGTDRVSGVPLSAMAHGGVIYDQARPRRLVNAGAGGDTRPPAQTRQAATPPAPQPPRRPGAGYSG